MYNCLQNIITPLNPCAGSIPCKVFTDAACVKINGTLSCGAFGPNPSIDVVLASFCNAFTLIGTEITNLQSIQTFTTKVSLTALQIQNIGTTNIIAIPTPGAGKFIQVLSAVYFYNFVTTAYNAGFSLALSYAVNNNPLMYDPNHIMTATVNASNYFQPLVVGSTGPLFDVPLVNTPLYISLFGGAVGPGDGTVDIYITYQIITR